MNITRFITAGNIDDGKSTLTGRLLYDTQNLQADVLHNISQGTDAAMNLAYIADGLRSERALGITIDVAYKYFTTAAKKFIITDAPGHLQYTRNLVTGASNADAMIILIDARNGITEQTRRHSLVASFLRIPHVIVAVNKMDTVAHSEEIYNKIKQAYTQAVAVLDLPEINFVPISALHGDNVLTMSTNMPWYGGKTIMEHLEAIEPCMIPATPMRCSIQYVMNSDTEMCYAGKVLSGTVHVGDEVVVMPGNRPATISRIAKGYTDVPLAQQGDNLCIALEHGRVKRGDIIAHKQQAPDCGRHLVIELCWLNAEKTLQPGDACLLRIQAMEVQCSINNILWVADVHTYHKNTDRKIVQVNEIARITIETAHEIPFDPFAMIAEHGRGIFIDPVSYYTNAAFTIIE